MAVSTLTLVVAGSPTLPARSVGTTDVVLAVHDHGAAAVPPSQALCPAPCVGPVAEVPDDGAILLGDGHVEVGAFGQGVLMLRVSLRPSPLGVNTGAALSLAGMVSDDWPADSSTDHGRGVVTATAAAGQPLVGGHAQVASHGAQVAERIERTGGVAGHGLVGVEVDARAGRAHRVEVQVRLLADPAVVRLVGAVAVAAEASTRRSRPWSRAWCTASR